MADLTAKSGKCGVKEAKLIVSSLTTEGTKIFTEELRERRLTAYGGKCFAEEAKN